jgi:signal transduction histidine kinase/ligand-binding sensor domain-containing protein/DNA-binding response OmpR family regulator
MYHEFTPIDNRVGMDATVTNCVVQDNQGLIWLGTDRGLYSFDGYSARHYVPKSKRNIVVVYCAIMVDSVHLWLGADNGVFVFNTYTDCFEDAPAGLPNNIRAITRIDAHSFWIGGLNGLYRYNTQTRKAEKIDNSNLPHQAIYSILRYNDQTFYFGTYNGLCSYNLHSGKFKKLMPWLNSAYSNKLILALLPDYQRRCIWVGMEGGLFAFNPTEEKWTEEPLFSGSSVKSLLLDKQNCLWTGTDNGLYIYEPSTRNYKLFRHDALNDRSIIDNVIWTIFADREQNIWIGTDAGASLFSFSNHFKLQSINELTGSHEGNYLRSLLLDSHRTLWLGGTNGLVRVDRQSGKTVWYQQNNRANPLPHNKVRYIYEDRDGDVWIATDGSVCRYNPKTAQFIRYQIENETHTRNANWSYAICQDENRKLWVATCLGGLFVVDKQQLIASAGKTYTAEQNYYSSGDAMGLSGNMLESLSIDKDYNIWAGTYRAGINKIDRLNNKVIHFTASDAKNPLPSDDVTGIVVDEQFLWIALRNKVVRLDTRNYMQHTIVDPRLNNSTINAMADDGRRIWLGLSSGLFFIDKKTLKIRQVYTGGNLYSSLFYDKTSKHLLVGCTNAFLEFDPETASEQDAHNHLFITSLWINNRQVDDSLLAKKVELRQSTRFSKNLELSHNLNNLVFTFSEFNYNQQQNAQYAYKLEGLDDDWHILERANNRIAYNNLNPGKYELQISRLGSDGNPLPDPLVFTLRIYHPWYSSGVAKLIYSILFILLIVAFANYYTILNRLRFERLDKAKTMELTAHKINFLTNISHELKTPLSLIIGPLGKIIEQVKPATLKTELSEVRQNALKMSSLIHQMMDASRQEFDGLGLIVSKTDIVLFVQSVASVFKKPLDKRNVNVKVDTVLSSFFIEADVLKLEIVLNNILSNAAKFAPDNSLINIKIEETGQEVKLSVSDQGPGIDRQDLPHVFERFFQSKRTLEQNKEGSGVGLSIVKEYVQLHHGSVSIDSDGELGTTVEIILPVIQNIEAEVFQTESSNVPLSAETETRPLLLIVEDNAEIAQFISKSMSREFRCMAAANGKQGFEMATDHLPDIIVTDIMMPVMDGMEMCRKLKENISTSLIPVVMLTAKDDKSTEILGYRIGADAFIAKPFEVEYLSGRLQQLLKGRNLLVQKVRQESITQPKTDTDILSTDEKLLASITQIIEDEMTNPDLSLNVLCEKSGYSQKQIYRRIKSLTGQTAVDYIRSIRLKKAAMLLSRKTFTVAEVMYMVGFSNHSYFSKRFQEMYGKTPKQYTDEASGNATLNEG